MQVLLYIVLLLSVAVVVVVAIFRRRETVRQLRRIADEAEGSKQQLIEEQKRNQQLKQEMTNNIAHELKTPVSSIRGYLEILLSGKPVDEQRRQLYLERCYSQTLRLSELISDVSLINKLEESAALFPVETIAVSKVIEEVRLEFVDKMLAHGITFSNKVLSSVVVDGNHSLLYAIFRNLIENAIMYAGDGVDVETVCYKADEQFYYLRFYDTGCGVSSDFLPKAFDRFQRIDKGRSRTQGGTGLGLAIVKHSVLFHGGEIYVKNRDGGGLEFYFTLSKKH